MSDAIGQATATSTPTEAVQDLLRQIAEENNLDIRAQLDQIGTIPSAVSVQTTAQAEASAQERRLAALRHAS